MKWLLALKLVFLLILTHTLTHTYGFTWCKSVESNVREQWRSATCPPEILTAMMDDNNHGEDNDDDGDGDDEKDLLRSFAAVGLL